MNKARSHQIDKLAQRVFQDVLPPTWVVNGQPEDYAKDYLVEIGENNGDLTGSSFFVQLKGQERAEISADGVQVKFSLETKYAAYYLDKIKDLPVFLVVIDVTRKEGWWLFLQPLLEDDQSWRNKKSVTVKLPSANVLTAMDALRQAVDLAKKWMRLHHPESIHESVVAHREQIRRRDPRFEVIVSLVKDHPMFTLLPKEEVPLKFTFTGDRTELEKKLADLVDKGALVAFQPGEVMVTGSKLFEQIEKVGCAIQACLSLKGTLTVICRDSEGRELARLSDVAGQFTGGRKELWFKGELTNSPLVVELGPIAPGVGGSLQMKFDFLRWDNQRLRHLAYFDRLHSFFRGLSTTTATIIECQQDGNTVFSVTLPFKPEPFVVAIERYLETLWQARTVVEHFRVNPVWYCQAFDQDAQETGEQLYAVFFGTGWREPKPHARLKARFVRKTVRRDVVKNAATPVPIRMLSENSCSFLGEKIYLGKLVVEYTEMSVELANEMKPRRQAKGAKRRKGRISAGAKSGGDEVEVVFVGTGNTVMSVRKADPEEVRASVAEANGKKGEMIPGDSNTR